MNQNQENCEALEVNYKQYENILNRLKREKEENQKEGMITVYLDMEIVNIKIKMNLIERKAKQINCEVRKL